MEAKTNNIQYNRAKVWQIGFFAANNLATNAYAVLMMYVSYYATGVAGFAISVVSLFLTAFRIFDGITDPIMGAIIDRTNGKFGKFRPFMVMGNLLVMISVILIYYFTHQISAGMPRILFFIFAYTLYVLGYTMQTAITKAGQSALTNDPKQRPLFALFDTIMVMLVFGLTPIYISVVLAKKYGGIGELGLFHEFVPVVIIISAIATVVAVIGIWGKDRT